MVAPRFRSRSYRRVAKRTPGGRVVYHYRRKKPSRAKCAICKAELNVPRVLRGLPKSKKVPTRPYANLCSRCMRKVIKAKLRRE
ncbi:MAG: 50S ribosomal protein L34e [Candidatus Hydrothermarchaeota archaeon]|nr:MAG: 50S ribosomal protein L34e [Candidatus Hydrothermarchaeota archaeon]